MFSRVGRLQIAEQREGAGAIEQANTRAAFQGGDHRLPDRRGLQLGIDLRRKLRQRARQCGIELSASAALQRKHSGIKADATAQRFEDVNDRSHAGAQFDRIAGKTIG